MASGRCCSFKWILNLPDNIRSRSTTLADKEKGPSPPYKRTQHCWPATPNIVGCYVLRPFAHPVACCCVLFETGRTFKPTTPNISFVPWSPKRRAKMLDPLLGPRTRQDGSRIQVYKVSWVVSFRRCTVGHNIVGSCCLRLDSIVNTDVTPSIVRPTMLGVVASVCTQLYDLKGATPIKTSLKTDFASIETFPPLYQVTQLLESREVRLELTRGDRVRF